MQAIRDAGKNLEPPKSAILWPIVLITIGFLSYAAYTYVNMERETIMADWAGNRCNPFVMIAASYLKPPSDPSTPMSFAADNFQFCMKTFVQTAMAAAMAPVTAVVQEQASGMNLITELLNSIRAIIKTMMDQFMSFMDPFLKRFNAITYQVGITFQKLKSAFQKANATLLSAVFIGLSFIETMQNMINLTIKIVFIILDIMIAIIAILFFILWPLIPFVIMPVIDAISALGGSRGKGAESRRGQFCFVPETPVVMEDGSTGRIDSLKVGDRLLNGHTVEGILLFDGTTTPLFVLEGIRVSGSHLVKGISGWHSVADDTRAHAAGISAPLLYCLNTSNRIIPIRSTSGTVIEFRDWEEIAADDLEGQEGWDRLVSRMLGKVQPDTSELDNAFCLMDPTITVPTSKGLKALEELRIGDEIELSYNNPTRVIGLVLGRVQGRGSNGWIASCIEKTSTATYVRRTTLEPSTEYLYGRHVITESGILVAYVRGHAHQLRDFTEVGTDRIADTYSFVDGRLNMK